MREYGGISPEPFMVNELARSLTAVIEAGDDGTIVEFVVDDKHALPPYGPWSWYMRVED